MTENELTLEQLQAIAGGLILPAIQSFKSAHGNSSWMAEGIIYAGGGHKVCIDAKKFVFNVNGTIGYE